MFVCKKKMETEHTPKLCAIELGTKKMPKKEILPTDRPTGSFTPNEVKQSDVSLLLEVLKKKSKTVSDSTLTVIFVRIN